MTNTAVAPIPLTFSADRTVRIRRGAYAPQHDWVSADERTRHLTRMRAEAGTRRDDLVFAGVSAAAVWGLPILGAWPVCVEVLAGHRSGTRSTSNVAWHHWTVPDDDLEQVGPWLVTSLARTLLDLAREASFVSAVAALDRGLKPTVSATGGEVFCGVDRDELLDRVRHDPGARGQARALAALSFADPLSGSPGESLSRVQIHRLGFPSPLLQSRVDRPSGGSDYADFEWETVYGEFDGFAAYSRTGHTHGRSPADVVWDEKRREDRLRMHGKAVTRWTWEDAWNPPRLRSMLLRAGVKPVRRPAFSPDAFGEWVAKA